MDPSPTSSSITQWLEQVRRGRDDRAAERLWRRYCERLAAVARARLQRLGARRRAEDELDAAQEAFAAFFRRIERGAYPDCHDRDDLWCLLVKIADNKARQLARGERRQKRGAGRVRGDSDFAAELSSPAAGFDGLPGEAGGGMVPEPAVEEPSEQFVEHLMDSIMLCYGVLDDVEREVLRGQLRGKTNAETAARLGCVTRTVERKLKVIRQRWRAQIV